MVRIPSYESTSPSIVSFAPLSSTWDEHPGSRENEKQPPNDVLRHSIPSVLGTGKGGRTSRTQQPHSWPQQDGIPPDLLTKIRKAFMDLCEMSSGILLDGPFLKVGVKHEYRGNDGRMAIFFLAQERLHNFHASVEQVPHLRMEWNASPSDFLLESSSLTLEPNVQARLVIFTELMGPLAKSPTIHVHFDTEEQRHIEYPLLLPIVATSFKQQEMQHEIKHQTQQQIKQLNPDSRADNQQEPLLDEKREETQGQSPSSTRTDPEITTLKKDVLPHTTAVVSHVPKFIRRGSAYAVSPSPSPGAGMSPNVLSSFGNKEEAYISSSPRGRSLSVLGATPTAAWSNREVEQAKGANKDFVGAFVSTLEKKKMFESKSAGCHNIDRESSSPVRTFKGTVAASPMVTKPDQKESTELVVPDVAPLVSTPLPLDSMENPSSSLSPALIVEENKEVVPSSLSTADKRKIFETKNSVEVLPSPSLPLRAVKGTLPESSTRRSPFRNEEEPLSPSTAAQTYKYTSKNDTERLQPLSPSSAAPTHKGTSKNETDRLQSSPWKRPAPSLVSRQGSFHRRGSAAFLTSGALPVAPFTDTDDNDKPTEAGQGHSNKKGSPKTSSRGGRFSAEAPENKPRRPFGDQKKLGLPVAPLSNLDGDEKKLSYSKSPKGPKSSLGVSDINTNIPGHPGRDEKSPGLPFAPMAKVQDDKIASLPIENPSSSLSPALSVEKNNEVVPSSSSTADKRKIFETKNNVEVLPSPSLAFRPVKGKLPEASRRRSTGFRYEDDPLSPSNAAQTYKDTSKYDTERLQSSPWKRPAPSLMSRQGSFLRRASAPFLTSGALPVAPFSDRDDNNKPAAAGQTHSDRKGSPTATSRGGRRSAEALENKPGRPFGDQKRLGLRVAPLSDSHDDEKKLASSKTPKGRNLALGVSDINVNVASHPGRDEKRPGLPLAPMSDGEDDDVASLSDGEDDEIVPLSDEEDDDDKPVLAESKYRRGRLAAFAESKPEEEKDGVPFSNLSVDEDKSKFTRSGLRAEPLSAEIKLNQRNVLMDEEDAGKPSFSFRRGFNSASISVPKKENSKLPSASLSKVSSTSDQEGMPSTLPIKKRPFASQQKSISAPLPVSEKIESDQPSDVGDAQSSKMSIHNERETQQQARDEKQSAVKSTFQTSLQTSIQSDPVPAGQDEGSEMLSTRTGELQMTGKSNVAAAGQNGESQMGSSRIRELQMSLSSNHAPTEQDAGSKRASRIRELKMVLSSKSRIKELQMSLSLSQTPAKGDRVSQQGSLVVRELKINVVPALQDGGSQMEPVKVRELERPRPSSHRSAVMEGGEPRIRSSKIGNLQIYTTPKNAPVAQDEETQIRLSRERELQSSLKPTPAPVGENWESQMLSTSVGVLQKSQLSKLPVEDGESQVRSSRTSEQQKSDAEVQRSVKSELAPEVQVGESLIGSLGVGVLQSSPSSEVAPAVEGDGSQMGSSRVIELQRSISGKLIQSFKVRELQRTILSKLTVPAQEERSQGSSGVPVQKMCPSSQFPSSAQDGELQMGSPAVALSAQRAPSVQDGEPLVGLPIVADHESSSPSQLAVTLQDTEREMESSRVGDVQRSLPSDLAQPVPDGKSRLELSRQGETICSVPSRLVRGDDEEDSRPFVRFEQVKSTSRQMQRAPPSGDVPEKGTGLRPQVGSRQGTMGELFPTRRSSGYSREKEKLGSLRSESSSAQVESRSSSAHVQREKDNGLRPRGGSGHGKMSKSSKQDAISGSSHLSKEKWESPGLNVAQSSSSGQAKLGSPSDPLPPEKDSRLRPLGGSRHGKMVKSSSTRDELSGSSHHSKKESLPTHLTSSSRAVLSGSPQKPQEKWQRQKNGVFRRGSLRGVEASSNQASDHGTGVRTADNEERFSKPSVRKESASTKERKKIFESKISNSNSSEVLQGPFPKAWPSKGTTPGPLSVTKSFLPKVLSGRSRSDVPVPEILPKVLTGRSRSDVPAPEKEKGFFRGGSWHGLLARSSSAQESISGSSHHSTKRFNKRASSKKDTLGSSSDHTLPNKDKGLRPLRGGSRHEKIAKSSSTRDAFSGSNHSAGKLESQRASPSTRGVSRSSSDIGLRGKDNVLRPQRGSRHGKMLRSSSTRDSFSGSSLHSAGKFEPDRPIVLHRTSSSTKVISRLSSDVSATEKDSGLRQLTGSRHGETVRSASTGSLLSGSSHSTDTLESHETNFSQRASSSRQLTARSSSDPVTTEARPLGGSLHGKMVKSSSTRNSLSASSLHSALESQRPNVLQKSSSSTRVISRTPSDSLRPLGESRHGGSVRSASSRDVLSESSHSSDTLEAHVANFFQRASSSRQLTSGSSVTPETDNSLQHLGGSRHGKMVKSSSTRDAVSGSSLHSALGSQRPNSFQRSSSSTRVISRSTSDLGRREAQNALPARGGSRQGEMVRLGSTRDVLSESSHHGSDTLLSHMANFLQKGSSSRQVTLGSSSDLVTPEANHSLPQLGGSRHEKMVKSSSTRDALSGSSRHSTSVSQGPNVLQRSSSSSQVMPGSSSHLEKNNVSRPLVGSLPVQAFAESSHHSTEKLESQRSNSSSLSRKVVSGSTDKTEKKLQIESTGQLGKEPSRDSEASSQQECVSQGLVSTTKAKETLPAPSSRTGISKIVEDLEAQCMSPEDPVELLTDCLSFIHENANAQLELGQSQTGVASLIIMMNCNEDVPAVQALCCSIIRDLCDVHDENRVAVMDANGLVAILVALLKHEQSMEVQINGLSALANLSLNERNRVLVAEMNGLEVLKTCMDFYVSDAELQVEACRVIAALSDNNSRNSKALAALRLGKAVVRAMGDHPRNETLFVTACEAVRAMTADSDFNRVSLATAGALNIILDGMERYGVNGTLQAAGCGALWNMTICHAQNAASIVAYKNNDGIRTILAAMKRHSLDPFVQEAGCGVLKNLTDHYHYAVAIGRCGGIVPILNAMRQHDLELGVQFQGCGTLCNLAMIDEVKDQIVKAGGISMIVVAMRALEESLEIQKQACRAFRHLSINDQNKTLIAASGGVSGLLVAMQRHQDNLGIQVLALGVLNQLIKLPRNHSNILSNNGVQIIKMAMEKYSAEKTVVKTGTEILMELGEMSEPWEPE